MIFEENFQYRHDSQLKEGFPLEWKIILDWIGQNKNVLEVGCHAGDFSEQMKMRGCNVTGIEINSKALDIARPFLTEAICGDIESEQVWEPLRGKTFDVVLYEHVLEHLSNPWQILSNTKNYLAKSGMVIIALPNISSAHSRFEIFFGNFNYEETGVMDKTHLRFFNQKTVREMITEAGFKVDDYGSSWQLSPLREFIDHLPLLTHLRFLFPKHPTKFLRMSPNLTDVVMLLKCSLC